jgi:hypothetical protein
MDRTNDVTPEERIDAALTLAKRYHGMPDAERKDWLVDQMVRALSGDRYDQVVGEALALPYSPPTWETGVPPGVSSFPH